MSEAGATAAHDIHAEHHELGFIRTYIFSTDHKMIGRQFMFASILMLIVGGSLGHDDALGTRLARDGGSFYQLDIRALYVSCGRRQRGWRG